MAAAGAIARGEQPPRAHELARVPGDANSAAAATISLFWGLLLSMSAGVDEEVFASFFLFFIFFTLF